MKNAHSLTIHFKDSASIHAELAMVLERLNALDPAMPLNADTRSRLAELKDTVEQWTNQSLDILATATEREPPLFDTYSASVGVCAKYLRWAGPDAAYATRKVNEIIERWLKVTSKLPVNRPYVPRILTPWHVLTFYPPDYDRGIPGERELEQVDGVFATMEKHSDPVIRFQGRCGRIWISMRNKKTTPEKAYKLYIEARNDTLHALHNPSEPAPQVVVVAYYDFLSVLFFNNGLDFRAAKANQVEKFDAWESMLDFNIVVASVITRYGEDDVEPDFVARKLALIDRTVPMIDDSSVPVEGGFRRNLKEFLVNSRSKLLEKLGKQTNKVELPAERVQTLVDISDLKGVAEIYLPTIAGMDVYAIALSHESHWSRKGEKQSLRLLRVPLSGGEPQLLGQTPNSLRIDIHPITGCQVGPKEVYAATRDQGLYAFPRDGGAPRRIDDKEYPSECFESLAYYDGRLYAGLVGGYLVSIDPATGKYDVLASSRRRERASPFDDGKVFNVPYLAADTKRQRLVFLLHQGPTDPALPNGLWSWDPLKKEFKRLLETGGREWGLSGNPIAGDHLLLSNGRMTADVDLATDKFSVLWAATNPGYPTSNGPLLHTRDALCQESFQVSGPQMFRNGILWSAAPFARMSVADKKQEVFPAPERKKSLRTGPYTTLLSAGENDILVGSTTAIWLIALRSK
jgi:hypothetical protein